MALIAFDLDNTLLAADSDYAWGEYVVTSNLVDATNYRRKNQAFYEDYQQGKLDIDAYLRFVCAVLADHDLTTLHRHRQAFIQEWVTPMLLPKARHLIESHRQQGDTLVIVTATVEFIARPIADLYGIANLIAPVPEMVQQRYTGNIKGIPSFGAGKVARLSAWMQATHNQGQQLTFYSDSANDIPLLEFVHEAVAVDPDPKLTQIAKARGWRMISLRD